MPLRALLIASAAMLCGSCSYYTDIAVGVLNGRLAFASLDGDFECVANINVSTDEEARPVAGPGDSEGLVKNGGAYWWTHSPVTECTTKFPVIYSRLVSTSRPHVTAKPLQIGVVYDVHTQGHGAYGTGRFRIRPDRRIENLPYPWESDADASRRLERIRQKFGSDS